MLQKLAYFHLIVITFWSVLLHAEDGKQKAQLDVPAAEKQCAEGHLGLCMRLGMYFEKMGNSDQSERYYTYACEGDDPSSCIKLADIAERKQDQKAAMHWLRRACRSTKGDGTGCYRVANFAVALKSEKNAQTWYKKACAKGHAISCKKQ